MPSCLEELFSESATTKARMARSTISRWDCNQTDEVNMWRTDKLAWRFTKTWLLRGIQFDLRFEQDYLS